MSNDDTNLGNFINIDNLATKYINISANDLITEDDGTLLEVRSDHEDGRIMQGMDMGLTA